MSPREKAEILNSQEATTTILDDDKPVPFESFDAVNNKSGKRVVPAPAVVLNDQF